LIEHADVISVVWCVSLIISDSRNVIKFTLTIWRPLLLQLPYGYKSILYTRPG